MVAPATLTPCSVLRSADRDPHGRSLARHQHIVNLTGAVDLQAATGRRPGRQPSAMELDPTYRAALERALRRAIVPVSAWELARRSGGELRRGTVLTAALYRLASEGIVERLDVTQPSGGSLWRLRRRTSRRAPAATAAPAAAPMRTLPAPPGRRRWVAPRGVPRGSRGGRRFSRGTTRPSHFSGCSCARSRARSSRRARAFRVR
jgi:hypothetical protein